MNHISKSELEHEFELATAHMTFETDEEKASRQILYAYFCAGALWAEAKLAPAGIKVVQEFDGTPPSNPSRR